MSRVKDGWTPENADGPSLHQTTGYLWTALPGQEILKKEDAKNNHEQSTKNSI